jgi:hypothetical protein
MPTNAELKTLVNTDIRSKTAPNSILKGKVADTIDAAYDYTDQEINTLSEDFVVKNIAVTVTEADIATLHTTGKLLFTNEFENVKVVPLCYYFKKQSGTAYSADFNIFYILDEDNNTYQTIDKPFLTNIGGFMVVNATTNFHSNMTDNNVDLILKSSSEFTGGTNGFTVYLTYAEIIL